MVRFILCCYIQVPYIDELIYLWYKFTFFVFFLHCCSSNYIYIKNQSTSQIIVVIPIFNANTEVCSWYFLNVMSSIIGFWVNIFKVVSYVYGLTWRILYKTFVASYYNLTMTLFQHYIIKNEPLYGVSYFHAELLSTITLSPTL